MKGELIGHLKSVFAKLAGKRRFDRTDFVILKTALMLAAVDGEVAPGEIARFRELAAKCRGYGGETFEGLWDSAVRSAGYLLLQSHFLDRRGIVAEFVNEAAKDFVGEIVLETSAQRQRAFEFLDRMAMADGEYSEVERACVAALAKRVVAVRKKALDRRYPRAANFERRGQEAKGRDGR